MHFGNQLGSRPRIDLGQLFLIGERVHLDDRAMLLMHFSAARHGIDRQGGTQVSIRIAAQDVGDFQFFDVVFNNVLVQMPFAFLRHLQIEEVGLVQIGDFHQHLAGHDRPAAKCFFHVPRCDVAVDGRANDQLGSPILLQSKFLLDDLQLALQFGRLGFERLQFGRFDLGAPLLAWP